MIDDLDDKHYLTREDYECRVFTEDGEVYAITVHNVTTEEDARKNVYNHFDKLGLKVKSIIPLEYLA